MGPNPALATNGTARCSITLNNKKTVFKIRKYYLRMIFFLMVTVYKTSILSKFKSSKVCKI